MKAEDFLWLIHPVIAVIAVFPLIGIVVSYAWQTRQLRLQTVEGRKSNIPAIVGCEHVKIGRWLASSVIGVALVGLAYPLVIKKMFQQQLLTQEPFSALLILLLFAVSLVSLVILHQARAWYWRGIFATLTGMAVVMLGCQDGVFRRGNEWYWSHYYYGIVAALLMIFSLAIIEEIYRDKSNLWRNLHTLLNCFALALFIGQGFTGTRDIFEIALYMSPPG